MTGSVAGILTFPLEDGISADRCAGPSREPVEVQHWLDLARRGDHAAFGRLVDAHQRVVFRTALAALGRPEDAEDVAQEAFLIAWQKLGGFRGDSTFRTWLLTIAWRRAIDRRRSRLLWWKRAAASREDGEIFEDIAGPAPSPEQTALARDTARRVRREIRRLSPTLRDTLLLAASGEHTYEEIGALLGAPIGTIKWRVAEARRLVAQRIEA